MDPGTSLWRIIAPYFVTGVEITALRVTKAAPIINYMVGWNRTRVKEYCHRKGWDCNPY